jgi:hypothetical protein
MIINMWMWFKQAMVNNLWNYKVNIAIPYFNI